MKDQKEAVPKRHTFNTFKMAVFIQKLIIITGRPAAGKTTLGEAFNTLDNYIHFDVDHFTNGKDPVLDSNKIMEKKDELQRSNALMVAVELSKKHGFQALFDGKSTDLAVWTPFYSLVCDEVKRTRVQFEDKHIVITHAVYLRSVRDYIRETLGGEVTFLILNTSTNLLPVRGVNRISEIAKRNKQTPQQYLDQWQVKLEDIHAKMVRNQRGFELMQQDEPDTFQLDITENMSRADVFEKAKELFDGVNGGAAKKRGIRTK